MTHRFSDSKGRVALLVSLAANIFLVAFTLGRFSAPGLMPPPGFGGHPPFPPGMHGGPPPFFRPDDLFTPDEMQADELRMRQNFTRIEGLRKDFAARLEAGPVGKDDVLKHFADIDQVMDTVKKEAQARAADKISGLSPEERQRLAQGLLDGSRP